MTLELTNKEIEARLKRLPFAGGLLRDISKMVRLNYLAKENGKFGSSLAVNKVWELTRGKSFEFSFAEYIYRNTGIMVEVA